MIRLIAALFVGHRRVSALNCPHSHVDPIWGDEINAVGGYRLQCLDCRLYLRGPVAIAMLRARSGEARLYAVPDERNFA